jgi:anti-sigma factor RsiW
MTREFPDELLSAFLDGELTAPERELVEQRLAASESDRQLFAELRSLKSDLASLPKVAVDAGFTDRIVRAALAAQVEQTASVTVAAPTQIKSRPRRIKHWLGIGSAIATTAACLVLGWQIWVPQAKTTRDNGELVATEPVNPPSSPPAGIELVTALRAVADDKGEGIVLRLKAPKGASVAAAIEQVGIPPGTSPSAAAVDSAYNGPLEAKYGLRILRGKENPNFVAATEAASEVVLLEAPLERVESALLALARQTNNPVELVMAAQLQRNAKGAEGEFSPPSAGPFAQPLNAAQYRVERELSPPPTVSTSATAADPQKPVRVLILVEQVEPTN